MNAKLCKCGAEISRWSTCCHACSVAATVAAATVVEPSAPLNMVGTDTFFHDLEDASDERPGEWAHPCDEEPLKVHYVKRTAEELCERVVEEMCEEAFEDAQDHVKGVAELTSAIEAALIVFNEAQTACSWSPRTGEVFLIPASVDERSQSQDPEEGLGPQAASAVPAEEQADAPTPGQSS